MNDTRVALLRGINVGGHGRLPMADLRRILAELGASNPRTYIQSGNAVFEGMLSGDEIASAIETEFGFRPLCMVLGADELISAAQANPFDASEPKLVHLSFLEDQPTIDPETFTSDASSGEKWHLGNRVFYLHTPEGYAKSKLAEKLERRLGVAATARNWNTVSRLVDMVHNK